MEQLKVTNYSELKIGTISEKQFIFLKITAVKVTKTRLLNLIECSRFERNLGLS